MACSVAVQHWIQRRSLLNPLPCFRLHPAGVSSAFILNGMRHALGTLGHPAAADAADGLFGYEPVVNAERQQVSRRSVVDVWAGTTVSSPLQRSLRGAHKRCVLWLGRPLVNQSTQSRTPAALQVKVHTHVCLSMGLLVAQSTHSHSTTCCSPSSPGSGGDVGESPAPRATCAARPAH